MLELGIDHWLRVSTLNLEHILIHLRYILITGCLKRTETLHLCVASTLLTASVGMIRYDECT